MNALDHDVLHVEILTPKQDTEDLDRDLEKFAAKYEKVMEAGYVACITDNPMGLLSFQASEVIPELELPVNPEQLVVHLNTFHTKDHLDEILTTCADMGLKYLLAVSGDGSPRMPKLAPEALGIEANVVRSVELIEYIHRAYPDCFTIGVAFNPYEPQDHELEKMQQKMDAGAEFVITQPIIGQDERVKSLEPFRKPVIIDVWMSKKLYLLSECVGYEISPDTVYDPIANLKEVKAYYPHHGLYLALLGFKTQLPLLTELFPAKPVQV